MLHVSYLSRHSSSILQNVDTNVVESLNIGIVAKLIGSKIIHFDMYKSY